MTFSHSKTPKKRIISNNLQHKILSKLRVKLVKIGHKAVDLVLKKEHDKNHWRLKVPKIRTELVLIKKIYLVNVKVSANFEIKVIKSYK